MDVDAALGSLGKFGRWQMTKYTMVCLSVTVSGCWHMMVSVFTGGEPAHHCYLNTTADLALNETIPSELVNGEIVYSKCERYVDFKQSNATMKCDAGWVYDGRYGTTIVSEWDLVCDKNYLSETSQSVFYFGVMVGALVFTTLADKVGRKPVHLGCQYAMVAVGLAIAFAPNYWSYVVMRFLLGAIREGAGLVGIVMACELFPAAQRTFAGAALELFWAGSWMLLALLTYLVRDWRELQITVTVPHAVTIVLIWLLPESIPWLVANGRTDAARTILKQAADFNNVKIPDHVLSGYEPIPDDEKNAKEGIITETSSLTDEKCDRDTKTAKPLIEVSAEGDTTTCPCVCATEDGAETQSSSSSRQYTCMDILRSRKMMLYTFVMCLVWFASGVIYYGLSLSTSNMPGGPYINFFLSGAVEVPAYVMTIVVLERFGRRWPLFLFHIVAAVVLFVNVWLPTSTDSGVNLVPLIVTLTNIGKFAMTAAFGTAVLYAPEIYPTNLRNLGFGLASVWGRIGGMIAPFTVYIGKIVPWIPGVIFSSVALVTGAMVFFLPETQGRPLPETIDEIEAWGNGQCENERSLDDKKGAGKTRKRSKRGICRRTRRGETIL